MTSKTDKPSRYLKPGRVEQTYIKTLSNEQNNFKLSIRQTRTEDTSNVQINFKVGLSYFHRRYIKKPLPNYQNRLDNV